MKKFIAFIVILAILTAVSTFEEIYTHNFMSSLTQKAELVSSDISNNQDNLNVKKVQDDYEDLKNFWEDSKNVLCYFTNYEKIKSVDESFVKLKTAIDYNDSSLAIENIAVIKEYSKFLHYVMGFNIANLF